MLDACPYCHADLTEALRDAATEPGELTDYVCSKCGKTFRVVVDWTPTCWTSQIKPEEQEGDT